MDQITLTYKVNEGMEELIILGKEFVDINKNICKLIYTDKGEDEEDFHELISSFDLNDLNINGEEEIIIKLVGLSDVTDISYIFKDCKYLCSISDFEDMDLSKISKLEGLFYGCETLETLPDISNWNTKNITSFHEMFFGCSALKSLPNISKWDTSNVTDFSLMFYGAIL